MTPPSVDSPAPVDVIVTIEDPAAEQVPAGDLAALARFALAAENVAGPAEMGLVFIDETAMAELNQQYRDTAGPTDVLSFPIDPGPSGVESRLIGDIVICLRIAAANAPDHAGTERAEIELLVVHGVLHIVGWDHESVAEATAMQARERALLEAWADETGGPAPRIETWGDPE